MLVIRKATEADIPEVCRLVGQLSPLGFKHDYTGAVEKFRRYIQPSPDYFLWVADLDGKVVATAMMHLQHKLSYHCGTAAHLEDVVVDRACRGQGVGERFVRQVIETAKAHDCYKLMLTCYPKTAGYYERFGFRQHDIGMRLELKEKLYEKE
jgi:N-acetylglutamate synthase-like GNAT family acetyltransferase